MGGAGVVGEKRHGGRIRRGGGGWQGEKVSGKSDGFVRFGAAASDREEKGRRCAPGRENMAANRQEGGRGRRGGRFSGAGGGFWLVSGGGRVAYWRHAERRIPLPSAGEKYRPVSIHSTENPLPQAASSPNSLHFVDETEHPQARDAPRRALSSVLFRGVVTPGLGMMKAAPFLLNRSRNPVPTPPPQEENP